MRKFALSLLAFLLMGVQPTWSQEEDNALAPVINKLKPPRSSQQEPQWVVSNDYPFEVYRVKLGDKTCYVISQISYRGGNRIGEPTASDLFVNCQ